MSNIILNINSQKRSLLSFYQEMFHPSPNDSMFTSAFQRSSFFSEGCSQDSNNSFESFDDSRNRFKDPFTVGKDNRWNPFGKTDSVLKVFGSYRKHRAWLHNLLEGFDRPRDRPEAYRIYNKQPMSGLFEIVLESTDNDEFFYHWFKNGNIQRGSILFYSPMDDMQAFRKLEFWDAWVCELEEQHSAYSGAPMMIRCLISAATLRYNKSIVFQKNWYITEINQKPITQTEQKTKRINRIYWMDEPQKETVSNTHIKKTVYLIAETEHYQPGEEVTVSVKDEKSNKVYQYKGKVDGSGKIKIEWNRSQIKNK